MCSDPGPDPTPLQKPDHNPTFFEIRTRIRTKHPNSTLQSLSEMLYIRPDIGGPAVSVGPPTANQEIAGIP